MTLVDTSVWIDHFRGRPGAAALARLLEDGDLLVHPWVRAELALGHLGRRRSAILADVERLPTPPVVSDADVLRMIDERALAGSGIGWVDAHLLGAALAASATLWTLDRRLARVAERLGVGTAV